MMFAWNAFHTEHADVQMIVETSRLHTYRVCSSPLLPSEGAGYELGRLTALISYSLFCFTNGEKIYDKKKKKIIKYTDFHRSIFPVGCMSYIERVC